MNSSSTATTEPRHDIDPNVKQNNPKYSKEFCEYIYSQYKTNITGFTSSDREKNRILRSYADGNQDTNIYMDILLGDEEENSPERKGWMDVDFKSIFSPAPKYMRKLEGYFLQRGHNISVTALDERAGAEREYKKFKKQFQRKYKQQLDSLNEVIGVKEEEYIPASDEELEIYSRMGGFKLPYEIAIEKITKQTFNISKWDNVKRKLIHDLVTLNKCACMDYVCDVTGMIKTKYLDPNELIIEYSNSEDYENSRYAGYITYETVSYLRKTTNIEEDELRKLVGINKGLYGNADTFNLNIREDDTYDYDYFRIPVLCAFWKSVDTKYETKKGNKTIYEPYGDGGYKKPKMYNNEKRVTTSTSIETIYNAKWIIGTSHVWDYGIAYDIPRKNIKQAKLPIHAYKIPGISIIEGIIPLLDQMQLSYIRMQNSIAKSPPKGIAIEFGSIENIDIGSGKMRPYDMIKMYTQSGNMVYKLSSNDKPWLPQNSPSQSSPITELQGGLGTAITDAIQSMEFCHREISRIAGLDMISAVAQTPGADTPVGTTELAMASTVDTLRPIYKGLLAIKESTAENIVWRSQIICSKVSVEDNPYKDVVNKALLSALKEAGAKRPMQYGIEILAEPTELMKQEIYKATNVAMQAGKNGVPLISMGDYLFIIEQMESGAGMTYARAFLTYREAIAKEEQQKNAENAIRIQAEETRKSNEFNAQIEQEKLKMEAEKEAQIVKIKGDEERKTEMVKHENKMAEILATSQKSTE